MSCLHPSLAHLLATADNGPWPVLQVLSQSLLAERGGSNPQITAMGLNNMVMTDTLNADERDFRALFELNAVGMAQVDPNTGRFVRVNRKLCAITGYEEGELLGMTFSEVTYAEDRDKDLKAFQAALAGRTDGWTTSKRYIRKDGQCIWVQVDGVVIRDASGKPVRSVATIQDVTEHKQLEESLWIALEKYRVLFDAFPLGITISDESGQILEANRAAEQLLGISRQTHVHRRLNGPEWRIIRPDGSPLPPEEYASVRALQEDRPVGNVEMGIVKGDDEITWITVSAAPIPLEGYGVAVVYGDITEHKRTEDALRESQMRYKELFDTSRDGLVFTDLDGRYLACNRAYLDLLGYETIDELNSKSYGDLTPPEYHALEAQRIMEEAMDRGYSDAYEKEYIRKSGERIPVSMRAWLRRNANGEPSGMWAIVDDISERRQAERERERLLAENRQQQEILERVMEHTHVHLAYLDAGFNFLHANTAYARGTGHTESELIGRNLFELFPSAETQAIFERVRDTGAMIMFRAKPSEDPNRPDLGTTYWDWSLVPVKSEQGKVHGLVYSLLDVTEREQAREVLERYAARLEGEVLQRTKLLQASEARLRAIFDNAALGIAVADADGVLVDSNPALQRLLGYSARELNGMRFVEFTHPDDRDEAAALYRELLSGQRSSYQAERRYVRKDGRIIWTLLNVSYIDVLDYGPALAVGLVEDITERKQAQEALVRAEKLAITGRLAASLAHEINNPLQSVIGCLALVEESIDQRDGMGDFLHIAIEELDRAAGIVTQLRNVNRPTPLEESEVSDVNVVLQHVATLTQKQCENHGVALVLPADATPLRVKMIQDRIEQVFLNLVLNAVEAMPGGGRLEIEAQRTEAPAGVQISFRDTGLGIPLEVQEHMFEPFNTTKSDGLGLGLYVTYDIVHEHGGHIDVESQAGKGTTFKVWLPER